VRLKAVKTVEI
jgi:hypothetical protein